MGRYSGTSKITLLRTENVQDNSVFGLINENGDLDRTARSACALLYEGQGTWSCVGCKVSSLLGGTAYAQQADRYYRLLTHVV
jgi:hypothetical protein